MSRRTDHAARANQRLLNAILDGRLDADQNLAAAQAEATLALVEQQRIANLIALASMAEDDSKHEVLSGTLGHEAVWTLATTKMIGLDDEIEVVNPNIAAALGIEGEYQ